MFNFLKKKPKIGTEVKIKIDGMHCTNCALTIDDTLEEIEGVIESKTNYAKAEAKVVYDPAKVDIPVLQKAIDELGYGV